jgi:hypothetical protein
VIVARRDGRRFQLIWPPWQPPGANGVAAIVAPQASTAWADSLLTRDRERLVVWAATATDPEAQALSRLQHPGVQAMTLAPARSDPRWVRLALEVACHLATDRRDDQAASACLTSWSTPAIPAGVVRIPHLMTVERDDGVTDTVVWELAPVPVAQRWLGGPLPDQRFFENHLDRLLRLRAAARRSQLPARAVAAGVGELLGDQELSIRMVYQHAGRFRRLLAGHLNGCGR